VRYEPHISLRDPSPPCFQGKHIWGEKVGPVLNCSFGGLDEVTEARKENPSVISDWGNSRDTGDLPKGTTEKYFTLAQLSCLKISSFFWKESHNIFLKLETHKEEEGSRVPKQIAKLPTRQLALKKSHWPKLVAPKTPKKGVCDQRHN